MSRKRGQTNKTDMLNCEPSAKIGKFTERPKKPKHCFIHNLPNELLEKIVGYISYWHRPRLRRTCRRMRNLCDTVLLHEFQAFLRFYKNIEPDGYEYAALTAIRDATWPYVFHGCSSIFCGTILPLIWNRPKFSPNPNKIKQFLKHFYKLVNAKIHASSQFARMLYTITLMGLLRKFQSLKVLASVRILPNYWRMVLELRGPWIGILWSESDAEHQDHAKLLLILCEIMIADRTQRAFKKVWECDSEVFVYGNDTSEHWGRFQNPTTVFTFKISATQKIISLLKFSLENDLSELPMKLPKNEFVVSVDVECKEALKWGCHQVHRIEIGPVVDVNNTRRNEHLNGLGNHAMETVSGSETVVNVD